MTQYQIGLGYVGSYPFAVEFVPDNLETPIYFWEGSGHMNSGGLFSAQQALEPQWRSHRETAGALWFVPFIERLARDERVDVTEVLEAYRLLHGPDAVMPRVVIPMGS
jgi:hypothetical protein